MGKTESIFECLKSGPKSTAQIESSTGLTSKQIRNLLSYHVKRGSVEKRNDRWQTVNATQREINRCVAFLEAHGYEFD